MAKKKPNAILEAHVRIPLELLQSPAFIALPASAAKLYLDLMSYLRSTNNGNISAALANLRHRGWRSPATLAKSLRQLEAVGLIAKTRETTGVHRGSKLCNLYRFTDRDSYDHPTLHVEAHKESRDYRRFATLADAKKAIASASLPTPKKKTTIQKLKRHDTDSVAIARINDTDSVVTPVAPTTETVSTARTRKPRKPATSKAFQPTALADAACQ